MNIKYQFTISEFVVSFDTCYVSSTAVEFLMYVSVCGMEKVGIHSKETAMERATNFVIMCCVHIYLYCELNAFKYTTPLVFWCDKNGNITSFLFGKLIFWSCFKCYITHIDIHFLTEGEWESHMVSWMQRIPAEWLPFDRRHCVRFSCHSAVELISLYKLTACK